MTTLQTLFFSELEAGHNGPPIPEAKRVYFQTRLRNRVFNFILNKFLKETRNGLTKAGLARRIGKTPDVINRMLGAPSNLTLDSVSDLLIGIAAQELKLDSDSPLIQAPTNYDPSDWIKIMGENSSQSKPRPPKQFFEKPKEGLELLRAS